ncbi:hypothetical protein PAEPH01_2736, partial [Pancytospora epiphaga]
MSPLDMVLCFCPTLIVTMNGCGWCRRAIELFKANGIGYCTANNIERPDINDEVSQKYQYRSFPKIFFNGRFIGGYTELEEEINNKVIPTRQFMNETSQMMMTTNR